MSAEGSITLNQLHELVLLYLGLARADNDLDPNETQEIALKVRQWQPNKDPALIEHVIREAELTYENEHGVDRIQEATVELGEALPESLRRDIMSDLTDIARADGRVEIDETHYINQIARGWGFDLEEFKGNASDTVE